MTRRNRIEVARYWMPERSWRFQSAMHARRMCYRATVWWRYW